MKAKRENLIICLCVIMVIIGLAGCNVTHINDFSQATEKTETTYQSSKGEGQIETGNLPSSEYSDPSKTEQNEPFQLYTEVTEVSIQFPPENVPSRNSFETDASSDAEADPFVEFTNTTESKEIIEILKKVMRNEEKFVEALEDGKSAMLLREYCLNTDAPITDFELEFAVVDMDTDGIPEVVINIIGPDIRLILHYADGDVVGYFFGIKGLNSIKLDGSFDWGYATYYGCSLLKFAGKTYESIELASYEHINQPKYNIESSEVTQEEFEAFMDSQYQKEDIKWYKLT